MTTQTPRSDFGADDDTIIRIPERRPTRPARRRNGPVVVAVVATVVVLLGGAYLVGYLLAGDKLPKNAQINGIAVGGLSRAAAIDKLSTGLGARAAEPINVTVDGRSSEVQPAAAGLSVDYEASVQAAGGGRSFDPRQIFRVLTGGGATGAVVVVDQVKLDAAVQGLASTFNRPAADAALAYADTDVKQTPAQAGITVQQATAATVIEESFLASSAAVPLPADMAEPKITDEEVDQVAKDFAEPAVSAPVKVKAGEAGTFRVSPAMIAAALTFTPENGTLVPNLDAAKLRESADAAVKKVVLSEPKDATVRLVKGKPKVIAAVDGTGVAADELKQAVEPALTESGTGRTVTVELSGAKAKFSTEDAKKLGVRQVTGEFTTYFPYLPYRNTNIGRAAELIDGTLLKPGDTFSLNGIVGERTKANGFTEGFIIKGGKFKKELGGGVSQVATTTFNAMFFAGLKDIEHQPHTLYIDRYPAGREATVAWPSLDLEFANDTKYGVLVQADVVKGTPSRQGSITVKMWSTKTYDKITSSKLVRSNFTTGRDIEDDSADCEPMSPVQGFTVNYQRRFYNDDEVVKRESFTWRYAPTDRVRCV